jgi:PleD family two-component response regulator
MSDKVKSRSDSDVLVVVEDLFFAAKIESVAKATGTKIVRAADPGQLWAALDGRFPGMIIIDLNSRAFDPLDVVRKVKENARLSGIRIVGFYSHVEVELGRAAEMAGCEVLRRSAFVAKLPELLK